MSSTFYGVLGVGPDADADAIRESYRERVKDVHPDVNDDPDADAQFQRLTTARDVLLDGAERARYDRLGHVSYVRHHVDCSAWTDAAPLENPESESTSAASERSKERTAGRDSGPTAGRKTEATAGSRTETNAGWATGPNAARDTGTAGRGRESTRAGADGATGAHTGGGPASAAGGHRSDAWRSGSTAGTRSTDRRGSAATNRRETRHVTGSYATSSFWEARTAAGTVEGNGARSPSLFRRVARGFRRLGPWVIVHAVFLAAAVGTCLYVYSVVLADATASLPLLLVLVGEVVLAVILSSIHVLSRLTR